MDPTFAEDRSTRAAKAPPPARLPRPGDEFELPHEVHEEIALAIGQFKFLHIYSWSKLTTLSRVM